MAGALIATAELAAADFAWLDGLRRRHYPLERNQVPAHLTLFRSLPPSAEIELRRFLAKCSSGPAPRATITGLMDLGGGVAFRIGSPELDALREDIAERLHGLLTAQDVGGWVPHITIQNKVAPKVARALKSSIERNFEPRMLQIAGLGLHRYLGGPWDTVQLWRFRGR